MHLYGKVESALVRAGCEPERRKFKPHVTLARFRSGGGNRIGSFVQAYNHLTIGPFQVDRFTLFRSHLGSEKAHYEELAEYSLGTSAVAEDPSDRSGCLGTSTYSTAASSSKPGN